MSEVTIEITQFCEKDCDYCSSDARNQSDIKELSLQDVEKFLCSLKPRPRRINISGGEPLAHHQFYLILDACRAYTDDVRVYTNALRHIVFNSDVVREITLEANVIVVPGREAYIPKKVDRVHLLKPVAQGRGAGLFSRDMPEITLSHSSCKRCRHKLLQADGVVVDGPCKKQYRTGEKR